MSDASLSILYVDDDPDIRTIVDMSLRLDPDIDLRMTASGEEALALVDGSDWQPDLILLDVMMPGLTGPETLVELRRRERLATVPAVFMTARGRPMEVSEYAELGAAGTILKPFDPLILATQIRTLIVK